jgi:hypothetical protein
VTVAWYAAYGSNTDRGRFQQYLARCSTAAEPLDDRPLEIDLALYFAKKRTTRWGKGGVAFVGPRRDQRPSTLARAWLLPAERIAEIGAMENGRAVDAAHLDVGRVVTDGASVGFPGGWYDCWYECGSLDGQPVVTLGSSTPHRPNPPGRAYLETVARGLRATHALDDHDVAAYLAPRAGLAVDALLAWTRQGAGYSGANE